MVNSPTLPHLGLVVRIYINKRNESTVERVMGYCLVPNHYRNQCLVTNNKNKQLFSLKKTESIGREFCLVLSMLMTIYWLWSSRMSVMCTKLRRTDDLRYICGRGCQVYVESFAMKKSYIPGLSRELWWTPDVLLTIMGTSSIKIYGAGCQPLLRLFANPFLAHMR